MKKKQLTLLVLAHIGRGIWGLATWGRIGTEAWRQKCESRKKRKKKKEKK
jgi:hypothetical protein